MNNYLKDRLSDDEPIFKIPDKEKIVCRICVYGNTGLGKYSAYWKGVCEKYSDKPDNVLFENAPCIYYKKGSDNS